MPFMDEQTIIKSIKNNSLSGAYLFCGNQPYSIIKYTNAFIKNAIPDANDFNLIRFEGENFDIVKFEEAVNSVPFFADKKLVVVNEPDEAKMDKQTTDSLIKILKNVPDTTIVLIYITGYEINSNDKKNTHNKFATLLSKAGVNVCEFLMKNPTQTAFYIQDEFSKRGKSISKADADYLAEITLSNEGIIENEIDKLSSYSEDSKITLDMINKLVPKNLSVSIFDLTTSIIQGNVKKAMIILDELFNQKVEPTNILAVLSNGFMDFYRAKIAISNSVRIDKAADEFAYYNRKFALEKASRMVSKKSITYFRKSIKMLEKASLDLFTISVEEREYLETLIVKLALLDN